MGYTEDIVSDTVTLDSGQTVSGQRADGHFEVSTERADTLLVYIDDGTTGNQPAQYTITHEVEKHGAWRFDQDATGETARAWRLDVSGPRWRIDLENTSGTNGQTYRVVVESRVENAN